MTRRRIARMQRLVSLRLQERRQRELEHAEAELAAQQARESRELQANCCDDLDRQRDEFLAGEVSADDLELIAAARVAATRKLKAAGEAVVAAESQAGERRDLLIGAHQAHRSLEILHDKALTRQTRDELRSEQRELDDIALRALGLGRGF